MEESIIKDRSVCPVDLWSAKEPIGVPVLESAFGGDLRMSWDVEFPEPIGVPGRLPLVTLRDVALYFTTLPKSQQDEAQWQNAVHVLIQAADHGGPVEFARLGMMQAPNPRVPVYDASRKDPKWRNTRKLAA
jgi:hypothetical protein